MGEHRHITVHTKTQPTKIQKLGRNWKTS